MQKKRNSFLTLNVFIFVIIHLFIFVLCFSRIGILVNFHISQLLLGEVNQIIFIYMGYLVILIVISSYFISRIARLIGNEADSVIMIVLLSGITFLHCAFISLFVLFVL